MDHRIEQAKHVVDFAMFWTAWAVLFDVLPKLTILLAFLWWLDRNWRGKTWQRLLARLRRRWKG